MRRKPASVRNNPHPSPWSSRAIRARSSQNRGFSPWHVRCPSRPRISTRLARTHMTRRLGSHALLGSAVAIAMYVSVGAVASGQTLLPLAIDSARITISGTSNIHAYTASTTTVRVTHAQLGSVVPGPDLWANALRSGAVDAFEVAIPAATLTS